MKTRNLVYAIICIALLIFFYVTHVPIWFLFLILSLYYAYMAFKPSGPMVRGAKVEDVNYGVLGDYAVDGDAKDLSYGLYIALHNSPVFVDIRKDSNFEVRKIYARKLFENSDRLESSL